MTVTVIAANSITVGSPFTFAASGDSLIVLENVTLGSTGGAAISVPVSEVEVTVLGTLVSAASITFGTSSSFTLGTNASFVSALVSATNAALFMSGGAATSRSTAA